MSHKLNCIICYCECKSDEMVYENYIPLEDPDVICEECLNEIKQKEIIKKCQ